MGDRHDNAAEGEHVADDAAGKGIQARVNTPSDPKTKVADTLPDDEGRTRADDAIASGDLAEVKKNEKLEDEDQAASEDTAG